MARKVTKKRSSSGPPWEIISRIVGGVLASAVALLTAAIGAGWIPNPLARPTPQPVATVAIIITTTPAPSPTPQATQTQVPATEQVASLPPVVVVARDDCTKPKITDHDPVVIRVRWDAPTPALAEADADHLDFTFALDGRNLGNIRPYRQPVQFYNSYQVYGCRLDKQEAWVHWDVPVGMLTAGDHSILITFLADQAIYDGQTNYGPGLLFENAVSFHVDAFAP